MTAPAPPLVTLPRASIIEIARRTERAHADHRVCQYAKFKNPALSAAARRDAHLADLQLVTGGSWSDLFEKLRAGRLLEYVGGTWTDSPRTCAFCDRTAPVIVGKRHPRDRDVFLICRSEEGCLQLSQT